MKATTWLCPVLTLLCATRIVCTAQQRGGYPSDYADTNLIQDDYFLEKRNKPSLSIVNPLDVLRQRLLLEIARRQMKENTRQVELNRAILKNVGKRMPDWRKYQQRQLLQQLWMQQQQQQQHQQHYLPMQFEDFVPVTSIFEFLQQQRGQHVGAGAIGGDDVGGDGGGLGILARAAATLDDGKKSLVDNDDAIKYQLNGNEIENEIANHMDTSNSGGHIIGDVDGGNGGEGNKREILPATAIFNSHHGHHAGLNNSGKHNVAQSFKSYNDNADGDGDGDADSVSMNNISNNDNKNKNTDGNDLKLRYLYNLHRNHFARK